MHCASSLRLTFALTCVVAAVAAFLGCPSAAAAAESDRAMPTIIFFGDSLTAGYGLDNPAGEAYPALIQRKLEAEKLSWRAVNAGLSGETSAGGLRRVDWVLRQPVDVFFLALGANDGLRGVDPTATEQNLDQILTRVRTRNPNARLLVAGMEMPPSMGRAYTERYRTVFASVAKKHNATLLPFLIEGVAGRADLNQADAVHPTAAGHRVMAETVWKVLRPLL